MRDVEKNYEKIGKVFYHFSKKAKHVKIAIQPFKGVVVTIPETSNIKRAENFVLTKKYWIIKNKEKVEKREQKATKFSELNNYNTFNHQIKIRKNLVNSYKIKVLNHDVYIFYPAGKLADEPEVQLEIRKQVENILRKEAKDYLPYRVKYFAYKFKLNFNDVKVKNAKTRWGSCSSNNNINLSIHLMRLPQHLRDYVILHELAHTVQKNHGNKFWEFLDKLTDGQAKSMAAEMKHYNIEII